MSDGVQVPFRHTRKGVAHSSQPDASLQETSMSLSRREFSRQSALTGAGVALTGVVGSLA